MSASAEVSKGGFGGDLFGLDLGDPSAKTLKEKRAAKKAKHADESSSIPPTGH